MCFGKTDDAAAFDGFLKSLSNDPSQGNLRFVARNFLLDEGVSSIRRDSYSGGVSDSPKISCVNEWKAFHNSYLHEKVFTRRLKAIPAQINRADEQHYPETFRHPDAYTTFGSAHEELYLLRVENAADLSKRIGFMPLSTLLDLARRVEAQNSLHGKRARTATNDEERQFKSVLETWGCSLDSRPIWAGFWQNLADIAPADPTQAPLNWADEMRDRLGLYHLNPPDLMRDEIPVFVFRYAVKELPYLTGKERGLRPVGVPTVLDGAFSVAFCPVPKGQTYGFSVYFGEQSYQARPEIVHPAIQFEPKHLFRVGTIKRQVPPDLLNARKTHLTWLRLETGRYDYSVATDGD